MQHDFGQELRLFTKGAFAIKVWPILVPLSIGDFGFNVILLLARACTLFFKKERTPKTISIVTEDGRSMSVFSLYWQLSLGRMANFPAFIASKSFDL